MTIHKAKKSKIKIALIGAGTVGGGVIEILQQQKEALKRKLGFELVLEKVYTRTPKKAFDLGVKAGQIAHSWKEIIANPDIDIVIELMGGTEEARVIIKQALIAKKQVVTANKALLALHGKEVFDLAAKNKVQVCFEASVGGGIPILRSLREGFSACEVQSIQAIINGTCNYILSNMADAGSDFPSTLKSAQELGYAEQDPTFDIEGIDAAHKLCILTALAFGTYIPFKKISTQGITQLTPLDFESAFRFGYCIKLLAIAKRSNPKSAIEARVHPTMIPLSSPLASVKDAFNAILIEAQPVGRSLLYGRGAGRGPTASAVMGDVIEIARRLYVGDAIPPLVPPLGYEATSLQEWKSIDSQKNKFPTQDSAWYLRFSVLDKPGVLAKITGILGSNAISIASVYQHDINLGKKVSVVLLTHPCSQQKLETALKKINALSYIKDKTLKVRIEHG